MTNRAKAKGTFAENCVRDHLRARYPDRMLNGAGHLWNRVTSRGSKDEGDVLGPHTSIEVKNYATVKESALLDNATGKGVSSGLRYWFLVYKAHGKGLKQIGSWHAVTTVGHLLSDAGWAVKIEGMTSEQSLAAVVDMCARGDIVLGDFSAPAYGESLPDSPWAARLVFANFMTGREKRRSAMLDAQRLNIALRGAREIPFVISPRAEPGPDGKMVMRPVSEWYAYALFDDFVDALEAVGVVPQQANDERFQSLLAV